MTNRTPPLGFETRAATFRPSTVNEKARSVELVWSTGAKVLRSTWSEGAFWEELDMKGAKLDRLNNGAPFLADHNGSSVLRTYGVVESARVEGGEGIATVRFDTAENDPDADKLFRKIKNGIVQNISVGYRTHEIQKVTTEGEQHPTFRVTSWTPYELSAVTMGADDGAGFRSATNNLNKEQNVKIKKTNAPDLGDGGGGGVDPTQAERARAAGLIHACKALGPAGAARAEQMIANGTSLEKARATVLDELATRDPEISNTRIEFGTDHGQEGITRRLKIQGEALAARVAGAPPPTGEARQYARWSIVDHARHLLEARGIPTRMLSDSAIITRASTGDFPNLLQATGDRVLMDGYRQVSGGIKSLARKSSARDFRSKSFLRLSETPALLEVPENAEVKSGAMSESEEGYSLKTYARIFSLSRQGMINDDLGAFQLVREYGKAAAELENQKLVDLLVSNPAMFDTNALFSVAHGNISAAAAAPNLTTIGAGMKALRLQKGLDGVTPVDITPDAIVVPAAYEMAARQYVAELVYASRSDIQPFKLGAIVDSRLDAASATDWYLASSQNPCMEYSFLDGAEGPQVTVEEGFTVLGTSFRCVHDFGCGAIDWRGMYKNTTP